MVAAEDFNCNVPEINYTPRTNLPSDPWYNDLLQNPTHTRLRRYRDVDFLIIRNGWAGALLAYLNFTRKRNLFPEDFEDKIHVHGGITAGCMYFNDGYGFGMDFMHSTDHYPTSLSLFGQGKYWSFDDVQKHCEEIIDNAYRQFS